MRPTRPYAIDRYGRETPRLPGVLDKRLPDREFIVGDAYSIANIACYPWIMACDKAPLDLSALPNLRRWHADRGTCIDAACFRIEAAG